MCLLMCGMVGWWDGGMLHARFLYALPYTLPGRVSSQLHRFSGSVTHSARASSIIIKRTHKAAEVGAVSQGLSDCHTVTAAQFKPQQLLVSHLNFK